MSLSRTVQTVDARAHFYIRHSSQWSATVRPNDKKALSCDSAFLFDCLTG